MVELVDGGSVINEAIPSSLITGWYNWNIWNIWRPGWHDFACGLRTIKFCNFFYYLNSRAKRESYNFLTLFSHGLRDQPRPLRPHSASLASEAFPLRPILIMSYIFINFSLTKFMLASGHCPRNHALNVGRMKIVVFFGVSHPALGRDVKGCFKKILSLSIT